MWVLNRNWGFHQCGSFWQPLLLTAPILSSCFLVNQAQRVIIEEFPITWIPLNPKEGQNVSLTPGGNLENIVSCFWYRAETYDLEKRIFAYYLPPYTLGQVNGVGYTGRETGAPDCSLHIRNFTSADFGKYTVTKEGLLTAIGHANVEALGETESDHTIFWVMVGCLAVTLVLIGTMTYFRYFKQAAQHSQAEGEDGVRDPCNPEHVRKWASEWWHLQRGRVHPL